LQLVTVDPSTALVRFLNLALPRSFNLRDLFKVFQGMLMAAPSTCASKDALLRLWVHESCRLFHDRLICDDDKKYFKTMLAELVTKHGLGATFDDLFVSRCGAVWGE
jgi:hypothetical protein